MMMMMMMMMMIYFSCVLDVRSDRNFMDADRHGLDQGCHMPY